MELPDGLAARLPAMTEAEDRSVSEVIASSLAAVLADGEPTAEQLAALAAAGGSFAWLAEEPEMYSSTDGEPV